LCFSFAAAATAVIRRGGAMDSEDDDVPLAAKLKVDVHSEDDDVPLAAKLQVARVADKRHRSNHLTARAPAGGSVINPAIRVSPAQESKRGPLGTLSDDLLFNIYMHIPQMVVQHTRVCRRFYKVLPLASRIHVELSALRPFRLTEKGLLRFVTGRHQELRLSINDSTALKILLAVLKRDSVKAKVVQLQIGPGLLSPFRLLCPVYDWSRCPRAMNRLALQEGAQQPSKSSKQRNEWRCETLRLLSAVAEHCRGVRYLQLDGITCEEANLVLSHARLCTMGAVVGADESRGIHPDGPNRGAAACTGSAGPTDLQSWGTWGTHGHEDEDGYLVAERRVTNSREYKWAVTARGLTAMGDDADGQVAQEFFAILARTICVGEARSDAACMSGPVVTDSGLLDLRDNNLGNEEMGALLEHLVLRAGPSYGRNVCLTNLLLRFTFNPHP
jgi:hypothetical protein